MWGPCSRPSPKGFFEFWSAFLKTFQAPLQCLGSAELAEGHTGVHTVFSPSLSPSRCSSSSHDSDGFNTCPRRSRACTYRVIPWPQFLHGIMWDGLLKQWWRSDLRQLSLTLHTEQVQTSRISTDVSPGLWAMHKPVQELLPFFWLLLICVRTSTGVPLLLWSTPSALKYLSMARLVTGILYSLCHWNPRKFVHPLHQFCAMGQEVVHR